MAPPTRYLQHREATHAGVVTMERQKESKPFTVSVWFSVSVLPPTGSVRGPAEDLRGLCRDPGQRHAGPAFEHYDPQVLAVLQAQQSKDKVTEHAFFCYWGQARREVLLFTLLVFGPNSDPFNPVQF